jgi:hypothetical protein
MRRGPLSALFRCGRDVAERRLSALQLVQLVQLYTERGSLKYERAAMRWRER